MTPSPLRAAILVAAVAGIACPVAPATVEHRYSAGVYRAIQRVLTTASNGVSWSLMDVLLVGGAALWIGLAWRDVDRAPSASRALGRIARRTLVWCAAIYVAFLAIWGLNYRRVPLLEKLPYEESAVTPDAVRMATRAAIDRLNDLHSAAHATGWPAADAIDRQLATAFARAADEVALPPATVLGRPKRTLLDWYFRRSGTDGMTDPFFLETLLSSNLLPFERPFVVAHEWSHLAGVGDEGEANFVGWLTCMRGTAAAQYSGWLFLYRELASAVAPSDRSTLAATLGPGPREDLAEIRRRYDREISPRLSAAGWRIYDAYLRANHVEAGAASYAEVVKLVLGVHLRDRSPLP